MISGYSGGPVLNEEGKVIGMYFLSDVFYAYSRGIKSSYMRQLLTSPKDKTSVLDPMLFILLNIKNRAFSGDPFLNRFNLLHLRSMVDEGSTNARVTLKRLDLGYLLKSGLGVLQLSTSVMAGTATLSAEEVASTVVFAPLSVGFGYLGVRSCAKVLTHLTNRVSPLKIKNR